MNTVSAILEVKRYLVCSTGEETITADNPLSLEQAEALRDEKQLNDDNETWTIVAELAV